MAGKVVVDDRRVDKPSEKVRTEADIRLKGVKPFVSRGGEKLQAAIEHFGLQDLFKGAVVLDVGASTGGFTHCALKSGAKKSFALDVGTNQLSWELRNHPQVINLEKTDIREFKAPVDSQINIVVADISFNSLARLGESILESVDRENVHFIWLVKPQFELDRYQIPKGGVVLDDDLRFEALDRVRRIIEDIWPVPLSIDFFTCPVSGRSGNREIFIYFRKSCKRSL